MPEMLILSIFIGFVLGIISGLIPGIHTNNFALILLSLSPALSDIGFSNIHIAAIILANSITHTFLNIIPSVYIGAPDADSALAVLPGHAMLLDGMGMTAIRLSAIGSAGSIIVSLLLAIPLIFFFGQYYEYIRENMGWILLGIVILMILTESGRYIEGQGSLVHLKYKFYALMILLMSGVLGSIAFGNVDQMHPYLQFGSSSILLSLLTGLFGASVLLISLFTKSTIPEQHQRPLNLRSRWVLRGIAVGSIAGSIVAWLPGVSSAVATVLARFAIRGRLEHHRIRAMEFIVSVSGTNTSNAIFGLIALFVIGYPRSGAMVAVRDLVGGTLDSHLVLLFLTIIVLVSIASYIITIFIGDIAPSVLTRLDYQKLCMIILAGLVVMVITFNGLFGLAVFMAAIPIGMLPYYMGIRKSHAMGVLLLPVMMR
ncbi:MAG: tripartite tricarboxylate transporter permease, partial [Euryarchaeota archaeon]|nr:tripartite tricarboxylate transporter permease [Euryarchaeota archaeon]